MTSANLISLLSNEYFNKDARARLIAFVIRIIIQRNQYAMKLYRLKAPVHIYHIIKQKRNFMFIEFIEFIINRAMNAFQTDL